MAFGALVDEDGSDLFVEGHLVISVRRSNRCQYDYAGEEMGAEDFGAGAIHGLLVWKCDAAVHVKQFTQGTMWYTPILHLER